MKCAWPKCNNEAIKIYCSKSCSNKFRVDKRRKNIKLIAIEYKGGKCITCGYNRCPNAMTFHHLDPTQKDFAIGHKGYTRSWQKVKEELDKCVLLCHNCHEEEHYRLDRL